jgi:hypothetical protein
VCLVVLGVGVVKEDGVGLRKRYDSDVHPCGWMDGACFAVFGLSSTGRMDLGNNGTQAKKCLSCQK